MAVIRQTEEKDELPALWRNVCTRERDIQSATGITSVISLPICLCNIQRFVVKIFSWFAQTTNIFTTDNHYSQDIFVHTISQHS